MSAPTVATIRPGVTFTPEAAASFLRLEADLGRHVDVNSTYRDWDLQLRMYNDWRAYVAGDGPKPAHSRAIHPKYSKHTTGLALDSDDWATPGFIALAAEHGWIRTAASDPTERHHFEYQAARDQHRNDPTPDLTELGDTMSLRIVDSPAYRAARQRVIHNGSAAMPVPDGWTPAMIAAGVPYHAYEHDSDLMAEINMVWQLGGLDADTAARRTTEMLNAAGGGTEQ